MSRRRWPDAIRNRPYDSRDASTTGMPRVGEFGGEKLNSDFDIRFLRDDSAHPRGWYDKYGIRHCVRREVRLAD